MERSPEKDSQPGNVRELDFDDETLRGKGGGGGKANCRYELTKMLKNKQK